MLERVRAEIARGKMFAPGARVGVAVSGGADSVCLLLVLRELAPEWDLKLCVLHVNHGLRGEESDADARFVEELAAKFGLEFHCRQADVRRIAADTGDNLEQAARRVRREFFRSFLESGRLKRVALGHTQSDQAETVLFRFLRGSGTAGLAGIRPVTPEGFVRPLLAVTRADVEEYLRARGAGWREDSSNRDLSFARNRIRHELLPTLTSGWNPALAAVLAGTASVAQDEEEYWRGVVDEVIGGQLLLKPPAVLFRAGWLA
ncbi:MAG: tRNA lysidine(34) synthetase TilS, partial [Bryobacteraceae bacterium]